VASTTYSVPLTVPTAVDTSWSAASTAVVSSCQRIDRSAAERSANVMSAYDRVSV
jgi:hypothetical protein